MPKTKPRCPWCGDDPLYVAYHDEEWGVPVRDDQTLFEFLTLEGAQAGLSWITILRKREGYRLAFAEFDVDRVARFNSTKIERLLKDPGIVRNRLKVESTVSNAKIVRQMQRDGESLSGYLWGFVDDTVIQNRYARMSDVPATTAISDAMSKAMKKRGFRFVGSTICYAFMQAVGMVNDHLTGCYRHRPMT